MIATSELPDSVMLLLAAAALLPETVFWFPDADLYALADAWLPRTNTLPALTVSALPESVMLLLAVAKLSPETVLPLPLIL